MLQSPPTRTEISNPRSEKCNPGETPKEAPFQDSDVFIRFPPNKKTTRQAGFATLAATSVADYL
jgi:hypothetical protein